MSRMKDLEDGLRLLNGSIGSLQVQANYINKRVMEAGEGIEAINERLERMEAAQVDSGKLVDRLIEMSLVNRGQGDQAAIHRAQSRLENNFSNPQSWGDDEVEKEIWPPPGCDAMDVIG